MSDQIVGPEPFLVEPGWSSTRIIRNAGGPQYRVLGYPDGTMRFEHRCDRGERGVVICAPALRLGDGHTVVEMDPLTVTPSILCPDCGTHGFIRAGAWVE